MESDAVVLIVAQPCRLCDGLQAILRATPGIQEVYQACDGESALRMIGPHRPALILLDAGLPDGAAWELLRRLKAEHRHLKCVILVDSSRQQRQARDAGADAVLMKGLPAAMLFETVKPLLGDRGMETEVHDELVFEFDPLKRSEIVPLIAENMVSCLELKVPVRVDMETGDSWGDTEPIDFVANPDKKLDK